MRHLLNTTLIREEMRKKEMSQTELSEILSVSKSTISDWLNNKCLPNKRNLQDLANELDVSVEELTTIEKPITITGDHAVVHYHVHNTDQVTYSNCTFHNVPSHEYFENGGVISVEQDAKS